MRDTKHKVAAATHKAAAAAAGNNRSSRRMPLEPRGEKGDKEEKGGPCNKTSADGKKEV